MSVKQVNQVTTIKQAVEHVAVTLRADVVTYRTNYYQGVVERYNVDVAKLEAAIAAGTRKLHHGHPSDPWNVYDYHYDCVNTYRRETIQPLVEHVGGHGRFDNPNRYAIAKDVDKRIEKIVAREADMAVAGFIAKMTSKLEGLAGSEASVEFRGDLGRNCFHITTKAGASFTVENNIIVKSSPLGKVFNQYPTTFHNVTLADGTKVKAPSEAKVKKALAIS